MAVVGEATEDKQIVVNDQHFENSPVDLPMSVLFGKPPKMHRSVKKRQLPVSHFITDEITIDEAVIRVLQHPAVANKSFLITIGIVLSLVWLPAIKWLGHSRHQLLTVR